MHMQYPTPRNAVQESESYFFALEPPLEARALLVEVQDRFAYEHELGGRAVKFSQLHVMLCGIGRAERLREPLLPVLRRAVQSLRAAAVAVSFDRFVSFRVGGDNHALALRGTRETSMALRFLRTAVGNAQYAEGLYRPPPPRFEAHAIVRHLPRPLQREAAVEPLSWLAREFVLIRSVLGRGVQEVVGRWPLQPD